MMSYSLEKVQATGKVSVRASVASFEQELLSA
jgi:hypothetical protein